MSAGCSKGTINLINAAKAKGVKAFVLQTSLLTNAPAMGQKDNPNYRFLNVFGGVLDRKLVRALVQMWGAGWLADRLASMLLGVAACSRPAAHGVSPNCVLHMHRQAAKQCP